MNETATEWNQAEFAGIELGDERLNARAIKLLGQLSAQPQAYINQACEDWAASKAAYRFFDNEQIEAANMLAPHYQQSGARMAAHRVILAIQDTSELSYSTHVKTTGLGPIGNNHEWQQGLLLHTTLAVTPAGLPLGLLTQQVWARSEQPRQQEFEHKATAVAEKESAKWLRALQATQEKAPPQVQMVTVCDREADIYEFLLRAEQARACYVVRAAQDRRLMVAGQTLWQHLQVSPIAGRLTVEVAEKKKEPARRAQVMCAIERSKCARHNA